MKLTNAKCLNAKLLDKPYKLFDGDGLYLQVAKAGTQGGKYWRFKYMFAGKERLVAFGTYPEISLADARERRNAARKLVANGVDPSEAKKAEKIAQAGSDSFEAVAREWHTKNLHTWADKYGVAILARLQQNIFPWLGKKPINHISAPDLLAVLRRMEGRGALETAHRMRATCGQVFRYGIATGRCERDPSQDLKGAIAPPEKTHFATINQRRVSIFVGLPVATADTATLIHYAQAAMAELYAAGFNYAKAGVVLTDLVRNDEYQPSLLSPQPDKPALQQAIHALNARYNQRLVFNAACGINPKWAMRADTRSPSYTTRWDGVCVVI